MINNNDLELSLIVEKEELDIIKEILQEVLENTVNTLSEFVNFGELSMAHFLLLGYNITNSVNNLCGKLIKDFTNTKYFCLDVNGVTENSNLSCNFIILNKESLFKYFNYNEMESDDYTTMCNYIKTIPLMKGKA